MYYTVYGKQDCNYCKKALQLLQSEMLEFGYYDILADQQVYKLMQDAVEKATGRFAETVPQIFVDGEYVGGYTELAASFEAKKEVVSPDDFNIGEL